MKIAENIKTESANNLELIRIDEKQEENTTLSPNLKENMTAESGIQK